VSYEQNDLNERKQESVYSKRIKAGKRRTYFFDVRATRGNDYFLTITESRKRFDDNGYDRHKVFVYKEDFNKFIKALNETVDFVKTDLMPDFDFDAFNHEYPEGEEYVPNHSNGHIETVDVVTVKEEVSITDTLVEPPSNGSTEQVDKW